VGKKKDILSTSAAYARNFKLNWVIVHGRSVRRMFKLFMAENNKHYLSRTRDIIIAKNGITVTQ
jgi:hypothetical protein